MHPKNKRQRVKMGKTKAKRRCQNGCGNTNVRLENTTVHCSCTMCGNPRKHFNEKTIQEKQFDESSKEIEND